MCIADECNGLIGLQACWVGQSRLQIVADSEGGGALCVPLVDCPAGSGIAKVEVLAIVN